MKRKKIIIVSIFIVSLFFENKLEVYAESYIAKSAPDIIYSNPVAYLGNRMVNIWSGVTALPEKGRDAMLVNDSFTAAGVGSRHAAPNWEEFVGYIYDAHVGAGWDWENDTATPGDKIFVVDNMYYAVCWKEASVGSKYYCKYDKTEESVDYGIVYIIANAENYLNKNGINPNTRTNGNLELSWFTQVAIWKYQNINDFANISMTSNDINQHVPPIGENNYYAKKIETKYVSSSATTLWNLSNGLVTEAKNASSSVSLTINYDGNFSIIEDKNSVKTALISTSTSSSISSYSLDISKAPQGTKVYNESNVQITNLTSIPNGTKFYLEIPVDSIENFTYDFNITATASYGNYRGYKYKVSRRSETVAETLENTKSTIVLVTGEPEQINSTIDIKASHIEDSASSIPKITYIAGILILLCGIGIVYVNIKPRKQEI